MVPPAQPQFELTATSTVPGAVSASSTSAGVRSSAKPWRVSSSRITRAIRSYDDIATSDSCCTVGFRRRGGAQRTCYPSSSHLNRPATHGLGREVRNTLALAGPIIASQLGQTGMNTADTIQVGPLGPEALAAAGIGSAIHFVVLFVGAGVLIGMGPLVSQAFGAGRTEEFRNVARQGFWLGLILAVPVTLVMLFGHELALLFGQ